MLEAYQAVVFDLDDTLYPEKAYVRSGWDYLGNLVQDLYQVDFRSALAQAEGEGGNDTIGLALESLSLPPQLKEHLILAYRYHQPEIELFPGSLEVLSSCRERGCPLYLVTDGRALTQRLKIQALGIRDWFREIFISEEVGAGKPDPKAFRTINRLEEGRRLVYVADNPAKDFVAPTALGWSSIGVRHLDDRCHGIDDSRQAPTFWVDRISSLLGFST